MTNASIQTLPLRRSTRQCKEMVLCGIGENGRLNASMINEGGRRAGPGFAGHLRALFLYLKDCWLDDVGLSKQSPNLRALQDLKQTQWNKTCSGSNIQGERDCTHLGANSLALTFVKFRQFNASIRNPPCVGQGAIFLEKRSEQEVRV